MIKLKILLTEASFDKNDPKSVADLLQKTLIKTTAAYNRNQASRAAYLLKKHKVPKDVEEKAWDILYDDAKQDPDWFLEVVLGM